MRKGVISTTFQHTRQNIRDSPWCTFFRDLRTQYRHAKSVAEAKYTSMPFARHDPVMPTWRPGDGPLVAACPGRGVVFPRICVGWAEGETKPFGTSGSAKTRAESRNAAQEGFHAGRTSGCHRNHRHSRRTAAAGRPGGAGSGTPHELLQQPQTTCVWRATTTTIRTASSRPEGSTGPRCRDK